MKSTLKSLVFLTIITALTLAAGGCSRETDEIKIGATFPLTGDNASYGVHLRNAIEILKDKINASGGIGGKQIEVLYQDDANEPKQAVSNLERFASMSGLPAVIGSAGSNCTLAMAPVANRTKTVIVSPTSSAAQISEAGPYVFRTVPSDAYQGELIANWIKELGYHKVAVFYVNNSWGVGMKDRFIKEFTKAGGQVVAVEGGDELKSDFRSELLKLTQAHPDALFMPTYSKQGGRAVKQARELGITLPLIGADPWDVPEFREAAGSAANGVMYTVFDQYKGPEYQKMASEYKKRYGEEPDVIAANGYDSLLVLAQAMRAAVASHEPITGETVRENLLKVDVVGATGRNKFDANGDVVGKTFTRKTIKDGKVVSLR